MSTKELVYSLIDHMTDEQLEALVLYIKGLSEQPNEETAEALREVEDMKKNPEKYKGYDDVDLMFKELLA